jgi:hypothetical protein
MKPKEFISIAWKLAKLDDKTNTSCGGNLMIRSCGDAFVSGWHLQLNYYIFGTARLPEFVYAQ